MDIQRYNEELTFETLKVNLQFNKNIMQALEDNKPIAVESYTESYQVWLNNVFRMSITEQKVKAKINKKT